MTLSVYTGGTTSQGPVISSQFTPLVGYDEFSYDISLPEYNRVPSNFGVFTGTLSAYGNLIAMMLNKGGYKYIETGRDFEGNAIRQTIPWLTGYVREYWKNPATCTFGADSAIPALTGVMPAAERINGSMMYYVDLQLTRVSGSNYFDNFKFIGAFNNALTWVSGSNDYLLALKKAEENNLEYYGFKTYQEFLSASFSDYKKGNALRAAIKNVGKMVSEIPTGQFGTVNSVAKVLVDSGLGAVGSLTSKLTAAGIPLNSNIYNELYTQQIEQILKTITSTADLETIQTVIQSNIPNMKDPTDYTSISRCSGLVNDSVFESFKQFGFSLYQNAPNFSLTNGATLAAVIDYILSESSEAIESLATKTSILPPDIIAGARAFLPESLDKGPVSILNVIGTPSGYLTSYLAEVNRGIDQIDKSKYGAQIRSAFKSINEAFIAYVPASTDSEGNTSPAIGGEELERTQQVYYSLLDTIANDPTMKPIVESINTNYKEMCSRLSIEVINFNKGNISPTSDTSRDNTIIYSFVSSLPSYAADSQQVGTDYLLYNMCQDNQAGQLIRSLLNQYKNRQLFSSIGVRDRSII